ncbi:type 1 glutamine amidotransferase [Aliiruegeria sabulilitoris]|uniref:type 1 glutamine amidotransferase n=1 Tax=Aliiruegeria sabulilitoris TaxID=1510458 RepID=UPI00082E1C86|nr:type 1 glutamine amidotransferase [Aliiruegeria sabulilitoris]NDR59116.1 type 1 glutamine amidotransferase [Pseudoruegeria sp. M32A2M]
MRIGILMTGHAPEELVSEIGDYPSMFRSLLDGHGFEFQSWAVVDGVFPNSIEDADGWLITGSRHGAYEDHPWIPPLEDFIRDVHASGRPLVGICFGHQVIAQALGGKVEKFAAGWSVGPTVYELDGEQIALNAWHQDQVVELPEGATVIGSSDFCENAALLYGDTILTIQPHPEFNATVIGGLIRIRGNLLPAPIVERARETLETPTDNDGFGQRIASFFLAERKG